MNKLTIFPTSTCFTTTTGHNLIYTSIYTDATGTLKNSYSYLYNLRINNLSMNFVHIFGNRVHNNPTLLSNVYIFKVVLC